MLFKRPIIAQSMRPGCIFVSHRSVLICFAFFMPLQILQACLGFSFPCLSFSECCNFLIFQKKVLARHFYSLRVFDELKLGAFTQSEVLFEVGRSEFCQGGWFYEMISFLLGSLGGELYILQYNDSRNTTLHRLPTSLVPAVFSLCHQLRLLCVFLFTPSSFDCYFQLAESTFSTCAIQRYFSISLYSFWGFWCTFFYDMCYITLMVNGYIWICKGMWWLCTVSVKGEGLSYSTAGSISAVLRGLETHNPAAERFYIQRKSMFLLWKRNTNGMKSNSRHINISSIFQETTSFYVQSL